MGEKLDSAVMTKTTAEAINEQRLVRYDSSGNLVYCDAGEFPLGVSRVYAASGKPLGIELLSNKEGTIKCVCSAAVTARTRVFTAADGKVSGTNTGILVGIAQEAGTGNNSVIEVLPELKRVPIVNTTDATACCATSTSEEIADVSASIPAADLIVGSVIRIKAQAVVANNNATPQLTAKLKLGTEVLMTKIVAAMATNDQLLFEANVVVRVIGSSGKIISAGKAVLDAVTTSIDVANLTEVTEDISTSAAVTVTFQTDASHADNSVVLETLEVEHIR